MDSVPSAGPQAPTHVPVVVGRAPSPHWPELTFRSRSIRHRPWLGLLGRQPNGRKHNPRTQCIAEIFCSLVKFSRRAQGGGSGGRGRQREGGQGGFHSLCPSLAPGAPPRGDTAHAARLGAGHSLRGGCDQMGCLSACMHTQQSYSPLEQSCMGFPFVNKTHFLPETCRRADEQGRTRLGPGASLLEVSLSPRPGLLV